MCGSSEKGEHKERERSARWRECELRERALGGEKKEREEKKSWGSYHMVAKERMRVRRKSKKGIHIG